MINRASRALLVALLQRVHGGALRVVDGEGAMDFGEPDSSLRATVTVHDPGVWRALLRGSRGLAEAYMDGRWDTDDLTALVRLAARNASKLDHLRERFAVLVRPAQRLRQWRSNTRGRSRRQIAAHYDLGDDLFELMLDERMVYSCGLFATPGTSLDAAQVAKLDAICDRLDLHADDHLLEVGTGWGALAVHAAERHGCRVTTTTISRHQYEAAVARVRATGVEDRVTVLLRDYRDLDGTYDKLVAIEMIEAVGWRNFEHFFERCSELLAPDGLMFLQSITIDDRAYEVEKAGASFITTYIFPGGCLPSVEVIARCVRRRTELQWISLEDITAHYVLTLRHWQQRARAAATELERLGYDARFRRMWELYLHYCEAGFAGRRIAVVQILLAGPLHRRPLAGSHQAALSDVARG